MPLNCDCNPEAMATGLSAVLTKVSPECSLVTLMNDEQHSQFGYIASNESKGQSEIEASREQFST